MNDRERSAGIAKPVFVDNRDGNTLSRAITTHLAALRSEGGAPFNCRSLFVGTEVNAGFALHGTVLRGLANKHLLR